MMRHKMMDVLRHSVLRLGLGLSLACASGLPLAAHALTAPQALELAAGEADERVAQLLQLAASDDARAHALIRALSDESVQVQDGQVLIVQGAEAIDAVSGAVVALGDGAEEAVVNNRLRGALDSALAGMDLLQGDAARQREAAAILQRGAFDDPTPAQLPLVERALSPEFAARLDPAARESLQLAQAALHLASNDPAQRIAAARKLAGVGQPIVKALLSQRLESETDLAVKTALSQALSAVERALSTASVLGQMFTGFSLGSILLLAALGLAITYGLMGVINMAHGELMMIGAYATYLVQNLFRQWLPPSLFDWYIVLAIPASFAVAALVGAVLERTVIRWLYGRPLETLLATWGISLVLMQGVRTLFGAQNVAVENPSWLSGGVQVMSNLILPYNRLAIIAFAFLVLAGVTLMINRTRLGLFVRGVTQNRRMAACVGINTARIDTYAFSLGAGIAGLAGCALSQVGNVGPDLGQSYIVDAFMVVVTGGVGQLAGTVYAALGLGVLNKFLEGFAGAVLAKIMVLVCIVVFIQKRPQGLFAMKGRSAEA